MNSYQNAKKIKIIAAVFLIMLSLGVIGYVLYPTISQSDEKDKIIAVAKENDSTASDRIDFNALLAMNPQTVGWVQINGTPISYPVVQTNDNDYYLHHNFSNETSIEGCIFLDYLCTGALTRNNVLYGHYMTDDSMFGSLWKYQDESYFKAHPIIQFDRPGDPGDWEIFSVYITEADYDYRQPQFNNNAEFLGYMNRLKARSLYDTGVVLSPSDEVLTLSTCIYTFDNARLAVHARKIK
jgi:sortase B